MGNRETKRPGAGRIIRHDATGKDLTNSAPMQKVSNIGVIVSTTIDLFRDVLRGVREYCNQHPGTKLDLISESGYHKKVKAGPVAPDCIVAQVTEVHQLEQLRQLNPHVVIVTNRRLFENCPIVVSDDVAVGRLGARHLYSLGYRTLAILAMPDCHFSNLREEGFEAEATVLGADVHVFKATSTRDIPSIIEELLNLPGPVGLLAVSDMHARWLIEEMQNPEEIIPNRMAILGVDDDSLQNSLSPIGISSIQLAGQRIGYEAAALGMKLASGGKAPKEPIRIAPRDIISRRSTDSLAIADKVVTKAIRLMRERMVEISDAADLVRLMEIPRRTLEVRFHKATGSTLAHEIANARICRARELLSSTDLSIKEIAFLVGFSEPRMLSLVFKRLTGEKPSDYRARVRPGN